MTARRLDLDDLGYRITGRFSLDLQIEDNGDYEVVPAPGANKRIRLTNIHITASGNTKIRFQEPSESLSGPFDLTDAQPLNIDQPGGILVCGDNLALHISSSGNNILVGGILAYEIWEKIA